MLRTATIVVMLIAVAGALFAWLRGVQQADPSYSPRIAARTWMSDGPAVAIDDAHWNVQTASRGYGPFVKLLASDGYSVIDTGNVASPQVLGSARVVVIANALGFRGVVRQLGQAAGIDLDALGADAFTDAEIGRLEAWVREGGSLLLVADQTPAGRAVQSLAELFGVTIYEGMVSDPEHSEPESASAIVFSRASKTLAPHAIVNGRSSVDAVDRVVTFTGQALEGPAHATKLLMFSGTAYRAATADARPEDRVSVAGLGQALAIEHDKGRVVVLGDAALLTSQVMNRDSGELARIGLTWPNTDNERFARHIMQWLSRAHDKL
jgi:hypothetical protein